MSLPLMVSAWSHDNQLTLGQVKVNEKSNEITALPALLENLNIQSSIVTTDAMNTQKTSANIIVEKGGRLCICPQSYINSLCTHKTVDAGHGRIEEQEVTSYNDIDWLIKGHPHPHLASIIRVKSRRFISDESSQETRYFISSIMRNDA